eukprot:SAG31_NODE_2860_length_4990_cov_2.244326_4_plen_811_part_00
MPTSAEYAAIVAEWSRTQTANDAPAPIALNADEQGTTGAAMAEAVLDPRAWAFLCDRGVLDRMMGCSPAWRPTGVAIRHPGCKAQLRSGLLVARLLHNHAGDLARCGVSETSELLASLQPDAATACEMLRNWRLVVEKLRANSGSSGLGKLVDEDTKALLVAGDQAAACALLNACAIALAHEHNVRPSRSKPMMANSSAMTLAAIRRQLDSQAQSLERTHLIKLLFASYTDDADTEEQKGSPMENQNRVDVDTAVSQECPVNLDSFHALIADLFGDSPDVPSADAISELFAELVTKRSRAIGFGAVGKHYHDAVPEIPRLLGSVFATAVGSVNLLLLTTSPGSDALPLRGDHDWSIVADDSAVLSMLGEAVLQSTGRWVGSLAEVWRAATVAGQLESQALFSRLCDDAAALATAASVESKETEFLLSMLAATVAEIGRDRQQRRQVSRLAAAAAAASLLEALAASLAGSGIVGWRWLSVGDDNNGRPAGIGTLTTAALDWVAAARNRMSDTNKFIFEAVLSTAGWLAAEPQSVRKDGRISAKRPGWRRLVDLIREHPELPAVARLQVLQLLVETMPKNDARSASEATVDLALKMLEAPSGQMPLISDRLFAARVANCPAVYGNLSTTRQRQTTGALVTAAEVGLANWSGHVIAGHGAGRLAVIIAEQIFSMVDACLMRDSGDAHGLSLLLDHVTTLLKASARRKKNTGNELVWRFVIDNLTLCLGRHQKKLRKPVVESLIGPVLQQMQLVGYASPDFDALIALSRLPKLPLRLSCSAARWLGSAVCLGDSFHGVSRYHSCASFHICLSVD